MPLFGVFWGLVRGGGPLLGSKCHFGLLLPSVFAVKCYSVRFNAIFVWWACPFCFPMHSFIFFFSMKVWFLIIKKIGIGF